MATGEGSLTAAAARGEVGNLIGEPVIRGQVAAVWFDGQKTGISPRSTLRFPERPIVETRRVIGGAHALSALWDGVDRTIISKEHERFGVGHAEPAVGSEMLTDSAIFEFQDHARVVFGVMLVWRATRATDGRDPAYVPDEVTNEVDPVDGNRDNDPATGKLPIEQPVVGRQTPG